jgi:hypothetical protein
MHAVTAFGASAGSAVSSEFSSLVSTASTVPPIASDIDTVRAIAHIMSSAGHSTTGHLEEIGVPAIVAVGAGVVVSLLSGPAEVF